MEIAAPWARLPALFDDVRAALTAVPHALVASCHLSHSYPDGACLYFTFAAAPPAADVETTYVALWDAGQRAVLTGGGNLSHHHGVGLNRARFMGDAARRPHSRSCRPSRRRSTRTASSTPASSACRRSFGPPPWPQP